MDVFNKRFCHKVHRSCFLWESAENQFINPAISFIDSMREK